MKCISVKACLFVKFRINLPHVVYKVANLTRLHLVKFYCHIETTLVGFILNFTPTHIDRKNERIEINLNDPIKPWFTGIIFDQIDPVSRLILLIFCKRHALNITYEKVIIV